MSGSGGTRNTRSRRRWSIAGGVLLGLGALVAVGLFVIYPRVGAMMVRNKLVDKLATKLGREVRLGQVDVSLGRAVVRDLEIRGPNDGDMPLIHIDRMELAFSTLASFVGSVELGPARLEGVVVTVRRDHDGNDNVRDMIERLRGGRGVAGGSGDGSLRPTSVVIEKIKVLADDSVTGATALVGNGRATWKPGELVARMENVTATTIDAPKAAVTVIEVTKLSNQPPSITIDGGALTVYPKLALSGIAGTIVADPKRTGHFTLDVAGSYGGVPGKLWTAKGGIDPGNLTASIDLVAAKFQLDKLAPILAHSPIVDYAETSVDTKLHLDVGRAKVHFDGNFTLRGLNVGHPLIADKEVHALDLSGQIDGTVDLATRTLDLTRGEFVARDVPFSLTGSAHQISRDTLTALREVIDSAGKVKDAKGEWIERFGPAKLEGLKVRLVIPPIDCQRFLTAIPPEMAPYMQGYKLRGVFDTDITLEVDWAALDQTKLDGHVGIRHCRVVDEPADSPKRLEDEFEHYVEVEAGQWISFVVGPSNDDFVPIADISPYLINSVMSTEDSAFYKHRGFITTEFRSALVSNLKAGRFRHGASSITMQFVKNVLLYRDKTLLRKLQELFLTWHVENTLEKDRILEIYFNVIEYGPGLYGIGPASWHFFSKAPKDLNPVEAAFFSSILPAPKERYKQYCQGTLNKWTTGKIERILGIMKKRDRLTEAEYQQALATPLLFTKDNSETEEDCLRRVKQAIKNARPTNPLKKK